MAEIVLGLDTLRHLEEQAVRAAGKIVEFRSVPELGEHHVVEIRRDGTTSLHKRESRRNHILGSLETVDSWLTYTAGKRAGKSIVVWVAQNWVRIVLDDELKVSPSDGAICELPYSIEFATLLEWSAKRVFHDQKTFVALLKSRMGALVYPGNQTDLIIPQTGFDIRKELIDTFSVLKFETRNRTAGSVVGNADFLGRELASEVSSGTAERRREVPTVLTLHPRVYRDKEMDGLFYQYQVDCEVVIDYENAKIALVPDPIAMQEIQDMAVRTVLEKIESALPEGVNAFLGSP